MNKFGDLQERQLKEFTIGEPQNKMQTFYLAKHTMTQESYAVKKILYTSQNLREQSIKVIMKQFQYRYHNLISPQFYALETKNNKYILYLFMERGLITLEQEIQRRKENKDYFSSKDLKSIIIPIYQQLNDLEGNTFPHRNVKPSNIIQNSQGLWKLSDTGLLSMYEKTREAFDAPELDQQMAHNQSAIDHYKCDIYSFGISIVQAATLMDENQLLCFKEQNAKSRDKSDAILNEIKRNYDKEFYEFLQACVHIQENIRKSPKDKEGWNLYKRLMESKDLFEGGSSNKTNLLSQGDQEQIDLLLKDIEEKCYKRLKKTCEEYFASDQFEYFKATKTMEPTSFISALRKIDIILTEYQIKLLKTFLDPYNRNQYYMQNLYDHEKNKTYMGDQIRTSQKRNLPELSRIQEDNLNTILKDMTEYAQRKGIDLREEFKKFDNKGKGQLSFEEFKTALSNVNMWGYFNESDQNLFKMKFESADGDMVDYELFIGEMENFLKVDDQELDGLMMKLYKEIRNRFNNIDDFMNKYEESRKLSYGNLQGFLTQANISANKNLLKKLLNKLDPSDAGFIIRHNLKIGFQSNIDQETHVMIYKIINGLVTCQITLIDLMKKAAGQLKSVSKNQILQEFQRSNINITEQELDFLISQYEMQIDANQRFDYRKFRQELYEDALRQGLKPLFPIQDEKDVMGKSKVQETKQGVVQFKSDELLEKLSEKAQKMGDNLYILMDIKDPKKNVNISFINFLKYLRHIDQNFQEDDAKNIFKEFDRDQTNYISSLDFLNRLGMFKQNNNDSEKQVVEGIQINKYKAYQKFFEQVNQKLILKQHTPITYFKGNNNELFMKSSIFIYKLEDLGIDKHDFNYEIEQVTKLLLTGDYEDNVDLDKMCKLLDHFQVATTSLANLDTEYACVIWFGNIDESMVREGKNFRDLFEQKSNNRYSQGIITQTAFEASLMNDLRLSKDYNYDFFYRSIKTKDSFDIEIAKLKEGLERERISQDVIKKLKSATDQNSPEHLFNTWDSDKDKMLNEKEFRAMVQVVNKELKPADIRYLFLRFDLRKKQGISLEEFKKILWSQNKEAKDKEINAVRPFVEEIQRLLLIYNENFDDYFQSFTVKHKITQHNFIKALEQLRYDVKPNSTYRKYADETFKFIGMGDLDIEYAVLEKLYTKHKDLSKEKIKTVEVDESQIIRACKIIYTYLLKRDLNFEDVISKYQDEEDQITASNLRKCLVYDMNWPQDKQLDQFLTFFSGNGIKDKNSISLKLLKQYIYENEAGGGGIRNSGKREPNRYDRGDDQRRQDTDPRRQNTDMRRSGNDSNMQKSTIKLPQKILNTYFLFISEHPELKERLRLEDTSNEGFLSSYKIAQELKNLDQEQNEIVLDSRVNQIQSDIEEIAKFFNAMNKGDIRYQRFLDESEEYYIRQSRQKGNDTRGGQDRDSRGGDIPSRGTDNSYRGDNAGLSHQKQLSNLPGAFKEKAKEIKTALIKNKVEIISVGKSFDLNRKGLCNPNQLFEELVRLKIPIFKEEKDALINSITMVNGLIDYQELSSVIDDLGGLDGKEGKVKKGKTNKSGEEANDNSSEEVDSGEDRDKVDELSSNQYSGGIKGKVNQERIDKHFDKICKAIKGYCKDNNIEIITAFRQFDENGQDFLTLNQFKKICKKFLKLDYTDKTKKKLFNSVFMKFDQSSRDYQIDKDEFRANVIGDLSKVDISKIIKSLRRQIAELENEETIKKEFEKIDKNGDGKVNFDEFQKYIQAVVRDAGYKEILAMFQRISNGSSEIHFDNFLSIVQEDHLNMKKIKEHFNNYCTKYTTTLENVFKRFSKDPDNQNFLNKESLENLCNFVGLKFDQQQIEDLFDYLDVNKDCKIDLSEFTNAIEQKKFYVDYNQIYRKMRRHIITKKINFIQDMKQIDNKNTGFIDQPKFENYFEKREFPTNKVELGAVFSQMSLDTDRINYGTLLEKIANSPFDLADIIEKINDFMQKFHLSPFQMFTIFDYQKDQILDIKEFDNMCNQIGISLAEAEVREAYHQFDINRNGQVTIDEFTYAITTFQNKKQEFNKPMDINLMTTKNYEISKMQQQQIYNQYSTENLFHQNQSQVPQNYMQMSTFQEFNGMNQSVYLGGNDDGYTQVQSEVFNQSQDLRNPMNSSIMLNPKIPFNQSQNVVLNNMNSIPNSTKDTFLPQNYNKAQYIQIIKQKCELQKKNPFIVFSQFASKQFFTCLTEVELEVALKDIGLDISPNNLSYFFRDYKSYRNEKFNYVNMVKDIMEIGDFFKQFVFKSMAFQKKPLVYYFNSYRNSVENKTTNWSQKEIKYIADYYDFILSEQEADQILKQMMTKGVNYGQKPVDQKRFTEWLGVEESYDPTKDTNKQSQSYFNVNFYLNEIKSVCSKYQIKPIDLFTYFDKDYDYTLSENQIDLLKEILETVGIFLEKHQLIIFYKEFQNDDGDMKMMRILRQIMTPGEIYYSVLMNMLRVNTWTLEKMFITLSQDKNQVQQKQNSKLSVWRIAEFTKINEILKLEFTPNEVKDAFDALSNGNKDQIITLPDFESLLTITALTPPEVIIKTMNQELQQKVDFLQKEVRNKKNPNKQQQQKNVNFQSPGSMNMGMGGKLDLNQGGHFGQYKAMNFGDKNLIDQQSLAMSQMIPDFDQNSKKFNMNPQNVNTPQNSVGQQFLQSQQLQFPPQSKQFQPQLQSKAQFTAQRSNIPQKSSQKKSSSIDYKKKDLTPNDYEKADMFIEKLSKHMQTEGFEGFEMSSNSINKGWFDEAALTEILENKYGITLNPDIRLCVYVITKGDMKGIHIDDLRQRLKISRQIIIKNDDEGQIRQDLGISKDKKVYNLNIPLAVKLRDDLKQIINDPMTMIDTYYDPYQKPPKPLLTVENFRDITSKIYKNQNKQSKNIVEAKEIDNLFFYLDTNKGGTVSLSEFKQKMFEENEIQIIRNHSNQRFTQKMNDEIEQLFNQCDTDKSGFLEPNEIKEVLSQIGINVGAQELSSYIQRFDSDGDNRISKEEFKIIMEEKLKSEMLAASDMQEQLRIQFNKQDLKKSGQLNRDQLMQVFVGLGATLNHMEFDAVFSEVDLDQSGTVDIDEMMAYILKNQDNMSGLAQAAVLNIRSARKLGIQDLKSVFQGMPSNFRTSFMRSIMQKGTNLPASIIKPRLDANQQYIDLKVEDSKDLDKSFLNKNYYKSLKNVKYIEFKVDKATGVPIPDPNQIPRINLKYREVIACLFDTNTNDFVGNSVRLAAEWKAEEEDIWDFTPGKKSQNILILKLGDFDEKKISSLSLCFELNLHYLPKTQSANFLAMQQDIEMSCSYGMISMTDLLITGQKSINLEGGEPAKPLTIKKDDVRAARTGVFGALSKAFTKITTSLKIQTIKVDNQHPDIFVFPKTILLHKYAIPLYQDYLEYFAMRSYISPSETNTQLAIDNVIKNFIKIINCPDTFEKFTIFWVDEITINIKSLKQMYQAFNKCCLHFYLMFSNSAFKFNNSDPSYSCHTFKLKATRDTLIKDTLNDLRFMLMQKGQSGNLRNDPNPLPFKLDEIQEDDEDDLLMYNKFFQSKAGFELKTQQLEN